jgi:peptidoglycan hydrolase-like protein with peptidoglycan-binding domain
MEITEPELTFQYQQANSKWPFIHQTELAYGLPRMLLFAVGSRETNLTNEVGDFGHGHGVWQLDDRSHTPPGGTWEQFEANVALQCATAAAMLHDTLTGYGGDVEKAAAVYNSGQPDEGRTTHQDYGIDVLERMQALQQLHGGSSGIDKVPSWFHRDLGLATPFMEGEDVRVVQTKTGAYPDGLFGPVTQVHVVNFQSHHGLTVDGIVGPDTARALGS